MNVMDAINAYNARVCEINEALPKLDDDTALTVPELFEPWQPDTTYAADQRLRYRDKLYRVVQSHTSQADWTPDAAPALYTEVAKPGEIPVWKQPTGAQDAYMKGDKVRHNDKVWVSAVDNNVWEPGVYGWDEVNGA